MKWHFISILLIVVLASSCSDENTASFQGHWHLQKFTNSYDSWEIHGDTIDINTNCLFEQKGYWVKEEAALIITIGRGMYRTTFPDESTQSLSLVPEPGTGGDPLTLLKTSNCSEELYLHAADAEMTLPTLSISSVVEAGVNNSYIILTEKNASDTKTEQDFSLQIDADFQGARLADIQSYYKFKLANKADHEQYVQNHLFIEANLKMEKVYSFLNALRQEEQFGVVYLDAASSEQREIAGLSRNLFQGSLAEYFESIDTAFDAATWINDPNRPSDFYDQLKNELKNTPILVIGDSISWQGQILSLDSAMKNWQQLYESELLDRDFSTIVLAASSETTWQQYLNALNAFEQWIGAIRDNFCQLYFGVNYKEATTNHSDSYDRARTVLNNHPLRLVEMNYFNFETYFGN